MDWREARLRPSIVALVATALVVVGFFDFLKTRRSLRRLHKTELAAIARNGASMVQGDLVSLIRTKADAWKPAFAQVRGRLLKIRDENRLGTEVAVLRREGNRMRIVVSTLTEPLVGAQWPLMPEMIPALHGSRTEATDPYELAGRPWLSAFAPIRDSQERVVGILKVDFDAALMRYELYIEVLWSLIYSLIALAAALVIGTASSGTRRGMTSRVESPVTAPPRSRTARPRRLAFRLSLKISLGVAALVSVAIVTIAGLTLAGERSRTVRSFGERLQSIAATGALLIDGDLHRQIAQDIDPNSELGRELRTLLQKIEFQNHLPTPVRTFHRAQGGEIVTVMTTGDLSEIGRKAPVRTEMLATFVEGQCTRTLPHETPRGRRISAFAPIRAGSGDIVGILEVDFGIDRISEQYRIRVLSVTAISLLSFTVSLILGLFFSKHVTQPMEQLIEGTHQVRDGNYDHRIDVPSRDEIGLLADSFNHMIEGLKERDRIKTEKERIESALQVARDIQQSLLPRELPILPGFDFAARNIPCEETGGDYYDFIPMGKGETGLVIADVTGHGIGPALITAETRALLRAAVASTENPGDALSVVNDQLVADLPDRWFVALFLGVLNAHERTLTFASAGHEYPLLYRAKTGLFEELESTALVLGVRPDSFPTGPRTDLDTGDIMLFHTDGARDTFNEHGEWFGAERMRSILRGARHESAEAIMCALLDAIREFRGTATQMDDITLMVVKAGE